MADLGGLGALGVLVFGAVLSAGGGYLARRYEDTRTRRAEMLTTGLAAHVKVLDRIRSWESEHPDRDSAVKDLRREIKTVSRQAMACSNADVKQVASIEAALAALEAACKANLRVQSPEFQNAAMQVQATTDSYVEWLSGRLRGRVVTALDPRVQWRRKRLKSSPRPS